MLRARATCGGQDAAACLLFRERRRSLPGTVVRRAAIRSRSGAGCGLVPHRERRGHLCRVAPTLAHGGRFPGRSSACYWRWAWSLVS